MPPCTCSADAMTRFDASEHQIFAVDAAIDASASSAPMHHAAQYTVERIPSTSTSMSAQRCFTAWNEPIGRPNCTRSLAYSTAIPSARWAPPSRSAAVKVAPRSISRSRAASPPKGMREQAVDAEPAELAGEVHRRLALRRVDELDREHPVGVAHDREVGRRRVRHRMAEIPRDARARLATEQALDPRGRTGTAQGVDGEHGRYERCRRGVRAERLGQDGDLDRAEPDAALGFGDFDSQPTLLDHRVPERAIERVPRRGVRAHVGR